jgi:Ring finger domain
LGPILGVLSVVLLSLALFSHFRQKRILARNRARRQQNQNAAVAVIMPIQNEEPPAFPTYAFPTMLNANCMQFVGGQTAENQNLNHHIAAILGSQEEGMRQDGDFFVIRKYKNINSKRKGGLCPICTIQFEPEEEVKQIIICRHVYHKECIDEWLLKKPNCPYCNIILRPELLLKSNVYMVDSFKPEGQPPNEDEVIQAKELFVPPSDYEFSIKDN